MVVDEIFIYWPEQCKYCLKALNTTYCGKNQAFMKKLNSMYREYIGTVEFKCDYFSLDKAVINTQENNENEIRHN